MNTSPVNSNHLQSQIAALIADHRFSDAWELLNSDSLANDYSPPIQHFRAVCLTQLNQLDDAVQLFTQLIQDDPHNIDYQVSYLSTQLARFEFEEALQSAQAILSIDPTHSKTLFFVGILYFGLTQFEQGLPYLEKAAALVPKNIAYQTQLGRCLVEVGQLASAVDAFKTSYQLEPRYMETIMHGSDALIRNGDIPTAITWLESGLTYYPQSKDILEKLSLLFIETDQPKKAAKVIKSAIKAYPDRMEYQEQLGLVMIQSNELDRAIRYLDPLVKDKNRESISLLCLYGLAFQLKNDFIEAQAQFDRAETTDPTSPLPPLYKSTLYFVIQNFVKSIECANRAIELNPNLADAYIRKAEAQAQLGDALAEESYQKALALNPNHAMNQFLYQQFRESRG